MVYALHADFSFIFPGTEVRGMAPTACKIANTKHVTNYCPAIKTLPAAMLILNQKANIATRNKQDIQYPEKQIPLPPGKCLWG